MSTSTTRANRPGYYTIREAACVLCVAPACVSRAVRLGTLPAVRRRGRLVIPGNALTRLLGEPTGTELPPGGSP